MGYLNNEEMLEYLKDFQTLQFEIAEADVHNNMCIRLEYSKQDNVLVEVEALASYWPFSGHVELKFCRVWNHVSAEEADKAVNEFKAFVRQWKKQ